MAFQKLSEFLLKAPLAMMFALLRDVGSYRVNIGFRYRQYELDQQGRECGLRRN